MNQYDRVTLLEALTRVIDNCLSGRSKAIGGYVARCCVFITLENGYHANEIELQLIAADCRWIGIESCPGALIFTSPHEVRQDSRGWLTA